MRNSDQLDRSQPNQSICPERKKNIIHVPSNMRLQQSSSSYSTNPSYISLIRLLNRLDQKFPQDYVEDVPTSRPTAFEMAKLKANVEYAQSLLQQLEADASGFKNPTQRQKALSDLQQPKNTTKRLDSVLKALEILEDTTIVHVTEEETPESQLQREDENKNESVNFEPVESSNPTLIPNATIAPPSESAAPSYDAESNLRNRFVKTDDLNGKNPEMSVDDALSHQRHEQDDLSESLLKMAQQLKMNSQLFGESLESEKAYLDAAATGLDKNAVGVEGAGHRMLQLKQGQNVTWFYQLKVYAALIGLALTAVIVFWLPKLRWGSFF